MPRATEHGFSIRNAILRCSTLLVGSAVFGGVAQARDVDLGYDTMLNYRVTLGYGLAVRTEGRSQALINGPVDPLQLHLTAQDYANGTAFTHTGLPITANFDDGDRNFKAGDLINNRISGLLQIELKRDNYGFVASGDGFYDQVYHHPNRANSPSTINKTGTLSRFTDGARYYDGQRVRLLESYGYVDFSLTDTIHLDLRLGKQLAAYGESLFFGGIASSQGPADATKAFVPGAEVKNILLPVNQVAAQLTLTDKLTLLASYKLDFKATEIFPVGDFYSIQDAVGPGATFVYGSINPVNLESCAGLLNIPGSGIDLSGLCNLGGIGGVLLNAPPTINAARGADITPSRFGQYAGGLKYQLTPTTNVGLYYLRYHDLLPSVILTTGYAAFVPPITITQPVTVTLPAGLGLLNDLLGTGTITLLPGVTIPAITTQIANERVPTSYNVKYYDGVHLLGSSFSTVFGPFNVAGEFNYRDGIPVPIQATSLGVLQPTYTRGKVGQALLSAIYVTNPNFFFDSLNVVTESGVVHVFSVDKVNSQPGIIANDDGRSLFFSKTAWGSEALAIATRHNVIAGWDLSVPISFSALWKGNPSTAGSFGPLFGEGDQRVTIGAGVTYLDNLEFGIGYNIFLGAADRSIRGSGILKQHPYTDRDNVTFSIKYNL